MPDQERRALGPNSGSGRSELGDLGETTESLAHSISHLRKEGIELGS